MKQILLFISLLGLFSFTSPTGFDEVISALKEGNATKMAQQFDNTIEIKMPTKSDSYGKAQAEMILKDFFSTNGVKGFTVIHQGENSGSKYCIGNLTTKNGTFRTTIYMKQKADKQLIQEISFEAA
jgi:Domain of unknown function (DUF4783)